MTEAKHAPHVIFSNDTQYIALTGGLWGVFREDLVDKWPRYNGNYNWQLKYIYLSKFHISSKLKKNITNLHRKSQTYRLVLYIYNFSDYKVHSVTFLCLSLCPKGIFLSKNFNCIRVYIAILQDVLWMLNHHWCGRWLGSRQVTSHWQDW